MGPADMTELAGFVAAGLDLDADPASVAAEVTAWRKQFSGVHYTAESPS
jgi:glycine hydroxymethyltransferase